MKRKLTEQDINLARTLLDIKLVRKSVYGAEERKLKEEGMIKTTQITHKGISHIMFVFESLVKMRESKPSGPLHWDENN